MTFTIDPIYVYIAVNVVLAGMLLFNIRKVEKLQNEVNSIWQQIALMAIASATAFTKIDKKLDDKEDGTGN